MTKTYKQLQTMLMVDDDNDNISRFMMHTAAVQGFSIDPARSVEA